MPKYFWLAVIFTISTSIFAQNHSDSGNESARTAQTEKKTAAEYPQDFELFMLLKAGGSFTRSVSQDRFSADVMAQAFYKRWQWEAGLEGAEKQLAFTATGRWWFLSGKTGRLSPLVLFECSQYLDLSVRTNTFIGFQGEFNLGPWFALGLEGLYGLKTSNLKLEGTKALINFEPMLKLYLEWNPRRQTNLTAFISSYETFRYPLFGIFDFGLKFHNLFNDKFTVTAEVQMRTIDLFTLSSYVDGFSFKIGGGIRIR